MTTPVGPQTPQPKVAPHTNPRGRYLARLSLLALGVVYGDIGTSPLYAMREAFHGQHGIPVTPGNVLGVLSLIFWSLLLIVTVKYHVVIIRADNKGEGGVLALMALVNGSRVLRGLSPRRSCSIGSSGSRSPSSWVFSCSRAEGRRWLARCSDPSCWFGSPRSPSWGSTES